MISGRGVTVRRDEDRKAVFQVFVSDHPSLPNNFFDIRRQNDVARELSI